LGDPRQLVTNGWFAITLKDTFAEPVAKSLAKEMKSRGAIPGDACSTNGNIYIRKVCCNSPAGTPS
jgi:hypothetical protein